MKYSVNIGYNEFVFYDGQEAKALDFARVAAKHMVDPEGFGKNDVIITVTKEEEKEENSNGMDV